MLSPDHAGLREAYGAALYLAGELDAARQNLLAALALGAPAWRVAYHLGLVEESAGRVDAALGHYRESVASNPTWPQSQARLTALERQQP